jgi:hypothetical protein
VLTRLPGRARVRFQAGRFAAVDGEVAVFALPNPIHRDRCRECQLEVEEALSAHFGRPVRLRLEVDSGAAPVRATTPSEPPPRDEPDEPIEWEELTDAPPGAVASPIEHVLQAFQGAEVVEE